MTREQAFEIARQNREAHIKADIEFTFGRAPSCDESKYGFRHGWYAVGEYNFCGEELSGVPYDPTQGGWAFL